MYQTISITLLPRLIKHGILLLDVREIEEYQKGHIYNSIHLPLSRIAEWSQQLPRNQKYYVICQSGKRSKMACEYLAQLGFYVVNVEEGLVAWARTTKAHYLH